MWTENTIKLCLSLSGNPGAIFPDGRNQAGKPLNEGELQIAD